MCGDCWFVKNPPKYDKATGDTSFKLPVQFKSEEESNDTKYCCFCGNKTQLHIFVRHDPAKIECRCTEV